MTVAVLASLQTFFRYAERAEKHRMAGAQLAALKRRLDLFRIRLGEESEDQAALLAGLVELTEQFNELEENSLDIPDRYYDQARREEEVDREGV